MSERIQEALYSKDAIERASTPSPAGGLELEEQVARIIAPNLFGEDSIAFDDALRANAKLKARSILSLIALARQLEGGK